MNLFLQFRSFHTSIALRAAMKKRQHTDLRMIQAMEKRKKKRRNILQKMYNQLTKRTVDEFEVDYDLLVADRQRPITKISFEEQERRALLLKDWTRFRMKQNSLHEKAVDAAIALQYKALKELQDFSPELFHQAICCDDSIFPLSASGPTLTPPIKNFDFDDGYVTDVTVQQRNEPTELQKRIADAKKNLEQEKERLKRIRLSQKKS